MKNLILLLMQELQEVIKMSIEIGDVVMPVSDCFADAGIEDGDNFLTLSEAGLADADEFPFSEWTYFC